MRMPALGKIVLFPENFRIFHRKLSIQISVTFGPVSSLSVDFLSY